MILAITRAQLLDPAAPRYRYRWPAAAVRGADGSGRAYRARTRPPSFIHFAIFPSLIVGHQISDVVAVLGSLNIIAAELDR